MKVIAVLNQKGGSGKTTIATHLARGLQLQGHSVLLVDSDQQGSARDWRAVDEDNPVPVIGLDRPTLDKDLKNVSDKEFIVIDGSPQATNLALSAIKAADFVLIPVQPSPYDVWATNDLVDLVQQRIEMTDGKLKAAFVVSRAIQNTNIGKEVAAVLQDYNLPVLDARIVQRVSYPNSASVGKTVFETESAKSNAVTEITQLVNEVKTFFDKEVEL
ncbi:ParA family partition ATPase [Psychrobacter sp. 1U2]|jgi:chromosome partitioning protein|uniref:ParA family partition ATPase n=1 Tax=unclassified Psychrobacter TaxID=196806 RepID=UPI000B6DE230|nr:peptide transporter [Psychrobacter sp.]MAV50868.1 peptide transporter [Hyphomonadaceae bacterium]OUU21245.1 MAG: peptide transporter [Planctomycetia bacterium TMED53]|tara:strand:- start:247 stop:894 length:648 start_codon:yes stop_codon:yes gene_type:complete